MLLTILVVLAFMGVALGVLVVDWFGFDTSCESIKPNEFSQSED